MKRLWDPDGEGYGGGACGTHLVFEPGSGLGVYFTPAGGDFEDGSGNVSMSNGAGASWSNYYWDGDGDCMFAEEDLCGKDDDL